MSMLSAQADKLQKRAATLRQGRWSDGADDAGLMEDAADTINELRGALQVASADYRHLQAERDRLREELADAPKCETCEAMLDCDECLRADGSHKELRRLSTENACLREMCRDMLHDAMENVCSKAHWCDEKNWQTCNDKECGNRLYVEMARELGIEIEE